MPPDDNKGSQSKALPSTVVSQLFLWYLWIWKNFKALTIYIFSWWVTVAHPHNHNQEWIIRRNGIYVSLELIAWTESKIYPILKCELI